MKRLILIYVILIFFCSNSKAQLSNSDFYKTEWFADNRNESFFKSDTVFLYKILKIVPETENRNKVYIKIRYNKNDDITDLQFKDKSRLLLDRLIVESWMMNNQKGKWKFNFKKQVLSLYIKNNPSAHFKIVSKDYDNVINPIENTVKNNESKTEIMIVKLVRIKSY